MMELRFTSARKSRKDLTSPTLLYRLDDEKDMPEPGQTHPWAGKNVCALRDRLMIEWVMSFPQSKKLLKRMVEEVTSCIRRYGRSSSQESNSGSVVVLVLCSNGAHLSPCFVEKLYDHFSSGILDGLRVSRDHRDALKGDWGRSKNKWWQVSCVPVNKIAGSNLSILFQSHMWLDFDSTANSETEAQFKKDPLKSDLKFADMILDFEEGSSYRMEDRRKYYIRSLEVFKSKKVDCWMLTGTGYDSATSGFRGAGIQPYSVHPVTGEAIFLLGHLTYGQFIWSDFGGFKSHRLMREGPRKTAARECYEETLGILGTTQELADTLSNYETNNCFKVVNVGTNYVEHFMRIPYKNYPVIFDKKLSEMKDKPVEVDRMKWFPLSSLKSAVITARSEQYHRHIQAQAMGEDSRVDGSRSYNLREPYLGTLCIADALNFLDSIAAIAESQHRKCETHTQHYSPQSQKGHSNISSTNEQETSAISVPSGSAGTGDVKVEDNLAQAETTSSASAIDSMEKLVPEYHSTSSCEASSDSDNGCEAAHETSNTSTNRESEGGKHIEYTEEKGSDSGEIQEKTLNSPGRKKTRHGSHQGKTRTSKRNKRRQKQLLLYGMGAGSFTARENYMNT